MQIFLILALLISVVAVIFAVQNVGVVTITFFSASLQTSLATALLVALAAGVLITVLVSIPGRVKGSWNAASQKRKFTQLEAERDRLQQKVDELTQDRDKYLKKWEDSELEISNLEQQMASLSGALEGGAENTGVPLETEPGEPRAPASPEPAAETPSEIQPQS
jgi:uncharacterized integral membrane protein